MRIINLASGSKGNSTFVEYGETKILIDVGLNEKNLSEALSEIGEKLSDIKAAVITHEHIDHIRALESLAKKYEIDFFIEAAVTESPAIKKIAFKDGKLHKILFDKFKIFDIEILPFPISHDALSPVGFTLNVSGSKSRVSFLTDLGVVTETVKNSVKESKMIFIESNYDENMLFGGKYPYLLKRRIAGEKGHLSNSQSLELAKYLFDHGTKCFILSHLSENNNTPEIAYLNYANYFESRGLILDKDVFIRLSYQHKVSKNFILKEEFDGKFS